MDSVSSSPITPATSIVPPSTPTRTFSHPRYQQRDDTYESDLEEEQVEEPESPLLNSLQLSDREQRYIKEISSTTSLTPRNNSRTTSYGQSHPQSVPAYKFQSLRNFTPTHSKNASMSSITDLEILQKDLENVRINQVQESSKTFQKQTERYSVYVQNEDFEIYRPTMEYNGRINRPQMSPKVKTDASKGLPSGHKWWKSHGKSNSNGGLTPPRFGILRHKKSKSDIVT